MLLYADDILLYVTNVDISIPTTLTSIEFFGLYFFSPQCQ